MRPRNRRKRLILSVESSFAAAWLVPRLERFKCAQSGVDVLIDSSMQIVDLRRGPADVAIRYGVTRSADLVTHRLFDDNIFPVCSPLLADGDPKLASLEDLSRVTLLHWDLSNMPWATETGRWFDWTNWLANVGSGHVTPRQNLRFQRL